MRKLLLLLLIPAIAQAQTYNQFKPANGILKGSTSTYATTAATSADVDGLYASPVALTGTDINTSNQVTATHLSGPLPATQGGSGQTTITVGDLLYGSASNVLSKLAGNTTTTKQFLSQTGNGTISAAPAWGALAAADIQGLAPVWTQNQEISDSEPRYILTNTGQGADLKKWDLDLNAGVLCFRTRTDADGAGQNAICATRGTTTALTNISLGYATSGTYSFPFTGLATFGGALTVGGTLTFGSTWTVTTGGTASLLRVLLNTGVYIAGTKFTTSGCSISSTTGGATAGTFTLGANSCSAVVTFGTGTLAAANGWTCQAHDRTAPTVLIGGESSATTSTATFTIPAGAGATDVISFSCMAY